MHSDMSNKLSERIICRINERRKEILLNNFNPDKEYINKYNFMTRNSCDIKLSLLKTAETLIDRQKSINKLMKYVKYDFIARDIEAGIFEFSLLQIVLNDQMDHFVICNYNDKLQDLCINLDTSDKIIDNQTFLPAIISGKFRPYFAAFLSPEQIHPKRWSPVIERQKTKNEALNNTSTTDMYKCSKCGERKMKISRLQLRSADEPESLFFVCLVCFHTFIK